MKPCAIICLILGIWVVCIWTVGTAGAQNDPWQALQQRVISSDKRENPGVGRDVSATRRYETAGEGDDSGVAVRTTGLSREPDGLEPFDPWQTLRSVFLPFSSQEEDQARHQGVHARTFQDRFAVRLAPYASMIDAASRRFDIPPALLQAVIMAESGGNSRARAGITSAKGLMQTIDSTFRMARKRLAQKGIVIADDPFDPEASIMAGAWYLDRMYNQALSDGKMALENRNDIGSWRYPLEYYYAGPGNGFRAANKIQVYSNGETRIIDKRAYSKKIQSWSQILAAS
jgi:hypothetical protein